MKKIISIITALAAIIMAAVTAYADIVMPEGPADYIISFAFRTGAVGIIVTCVAAALIIALTSAIIIKLIKRKHSQTKLNDIKEKIVK